MDQVIDNTTKRRTYPQNWAAYNAAQTSEKHHFLNVLYDLCSTIGEDEEHTNGRPSLPTRDAIFSICYKIYSTVSGRRFITDLKDAQENGFISKSPHFNSIFNYLKDPNLTAILRELIVLTSLPFSAIETTFAVDSSGFTGASYARWYDHKYGESPRTDWVKVHIACGTKTHIVTAVEIWEQFTHDTRPFQNLLESTAKVFQVKEVSGDKAYTNQANLEAVNKLGAVPYMPFKVSHSSGKGGIWTKMFHYFHLNQAEFMAHYHKRSNVETTFSMIKAKFGGSVRSKTDTARTNECLCKILCHNICVFIHEMHELGLDVEINDFLPAQKGSVL